MIETHYTPTIDEFHVGFEYEEYCDSGWDSGWEPRVFTIIDYATIENLLYHDEDIRVKYLDREDIKSLGWIDYDLSNDGRYKDIYEDWVLLTDNTIISLYKNGDARFIDGIIKNKSELKKIMKQLGINF